MSRNHAGRTLLRMRLSMAGSNRQMAGSGGTSKDFATQARGLSSEFGSCRQRQETTVIPSNIGKVKVTRSRQAVFMQMTGIVEDCSASIQNIVGIFFGRVPANTISSMGRPPIG